MKKRMGGMEQSLRKSWDVLFPFLIYFVVHDLAQLLLALLTNLSIGWFGSGYREFLLNHLDSVNGVLNAFALLIGMAAVWPMAVKEFAYAKEKRVEKAAKTGERKNSRLSYLLLVIFAISLALFVNILFSLLRLPEQSAAYTQVSDRQYGVNFILGVLIYGFFAPLAEEIVFRGVIYLRLKKYYPLALSILLSGLLFGIYHGNVVQALYGSIMGVAITFAYERYKYFFVPVLFHGLANLSAFVLGYRREFYTAMVQIPVCLILLLAAGISLAGILFLQRSKPSDLEEG